LPSIEFFALLLPPLLVLLLVLVLLLSVTVLVLDETFAPRGRFDREMAITELLIERGAEIEYRVAEYEYERMRVSHLLRRSFLSYSYSYSVKRYSYSIERLRPS
jgi:hypothetical protein